MKTVWKCCLRITSSVGWFITIQSRGDPPPLRGRERAVLGGAPLRAPRSPNLSLAPVLSSGLPRECYRQTIATTAKQQCRKRINNKLRVKHSKRIRQIGAETRTYIIPVQNMSSHGRQNVPCGRAEGSTLTPGSLMSVSQGMLRQICCLSTGESAAS